MNPRDILHLLSLIMMKLAESGYSKPLYHFLKELLDSDISKRHKLAEKEDEYGLIAEASLYVLPAIIVKSYSYVVNKDFWEVWDSFQIKGYSDIIKSEEETDSTKKSSLVLKLYKVFLRDNEDEFMDYWKDQNMVFSDELKRKMEGWKERFNSITLPSDTPSTEVILADIICNLSKDRRFRLIEKDFVTEFLYHSNDENYQKAILLFQEIVNRDTVLFPELTPNQALEWLINDLRKDFDFIEISAFQSLLINHARRKELLGF